jgi:dipeptide/tripeptide permease
METDPLLVINRHNENERESEVDVFAVACILLTAFCERLVYYSVLANMILFCTSSLGMSSTTAATINLVFSGN